MPVNIKGTEYATVAERIAEIQAEGKLKSVETSILSKPEDTNILIRAVITTDKGVFMAHAEEKRGSIGISGESPIEVGETSAVGRALAFAGYIGNVKIKNIASADEIAHKIGIDTVKSKSDEIAMPITSGNGFPVPVQPLISDQITAQEVKDTFDGKEIITCAGCACIIEDYQGFKAEQIASFSKAKFKKPLCIKCQKELTPKRTYKRY